MLPGTLPLRAILGESAALPVRHPGAFTKAILPVAAVDLVLRLGQAGDQPALWPVFLGLFAGAGAAVVFATNWHRLVLLGQPPAYGWGRPEWRYLLFSLVLGIAIVVPMMAGAAGLAAILEMAGLNALGPWMVELAGLPAWLALGVVAAVTLPLWLWLPAEAIGHDLSYEDVARMVRGERLRFWVLNAIVLGGGTLTAEILAAIGLPAMALLPLDWAIYTLEIGVLSLTFRYLAARPPASETAS